jgi:hypothetical protein
VARASRHGWRAHGVVTVAEVDTVLRAARAHQQLLCSAVGGVSTRTVRGGRRARRMVTRLTKGGPAPMRWRMGWRDGVSLRAVMQSRWRGSPAFGRRRAHWHRLGSWGVEGHQCGARRSEGSTGGRSERLSDVRTSAAGGRCRPMASGMLRLPVRTRGIGEKCRRPQRASPKEESTTRVREKKGGGGAEAGGSRGEWRHAAGGREGGGGSRWHVERGGWGVRWPQRVSGGAGSRSGDAAM